MNLKIPQKDPQELCLYLWKIIDLPKISKKELLYNISFKFFLISPTNAKKLINLSLKKGYLKLNQDKTISLSQTLENQLKSWQKTRKSKIIKQKELREKQISEIKEYNQTESTDFSTILNAFSDKATRHRMVTVSEESFTIIKLDLEEGSIEAEVSGSKDKPYIIKIDTDEMILKHDCHDFIARRAPNKKFCKHLVKFFFLIKEKNEDLTINLLNKISDSINKWEFTS
ncbi:MAG: hypothetical protein EU541_05870 [Promethearchaeota archaeon]|nr:MAG: hypothetical protein EU541_05870 [Candidatus Lokiarchaeota archaeon]